MNLKKNGQWSLSRLALLATIIGGIAMCVEAMPIAIHYIQTGVSPWTKLPADVEEVKSATKDIPQMKSDIAEIKAVIVGKPWESSPRQPSFPSPRQTDTATNGQVIVSSQIE